MTPKKEIGILIAEDDPLVGEAIQGIVRDLGYRVVGEALDGQQTIELAQSLQPDVILLDIEMPGINGLEAIRQLNETRPTPVVVLTAYETPALVDQASAAGVSAYLVKPPKTRDLDRAIILSLARFKDLRELHRLNGELQIRNEELQMALANVKTLTGLLPICASCKKIRDDQGYWHRVEIYIREHTDADFTTGICPECLQKLYPEYFSK